MTDRLKNQIAIITGGGRGIGAATAALFAREGARVVIASRSADQLKSAAASIAAQSGAGRIHSVAADVSDEEQVERLFKETQSHFGPPDILINNAAVITVKPFEDFTVAEWDLMMAVNLRGPFLCSRAAFHSMKASGKGGSIVHISSLAGIRGTEKFPGMSGYVVSKHGVIGLTESMSVEGRPHKIRVNCVAPGAVDTQMLREAAPQFKTETVPDDIAQAVLYLSDPVQAASVTGAVIEVHSNA